MITAKGGNGQKTNHSHKRKIVITLYLHFPHMCFIQFMMVLVFLWLNQSMSVQTNVYFGVHVLAHIDVIVWTLPCTTSLTRKVYRMLQNWESWMKMKMAYLWTNYIGHEGSLVRILLLPCFIGSPVWFLRYQWIIITENYYRLLYVTWRY